MMSTFQFAVEVPPQKHLSAFGSNSRQQLMSKSTQNFAKESMNMRHTQELAREMRSEELQ